MHKVYSISELKPTSLSQRVVAALCKVGTIRCGGATMRSVARNSTNSRFVSVVTRQRQEKDVAIRISVFSKLYAINNCSSKTNWECWLLCIAVNSDDFFMESPSLMSSGHSLMSEGMDGKDRLVEEIVLLALFLVSTAANSLALLVFCRRPGLRTISNRYVTSIR